MTELTREIFQELTGKKPGPNTFGIISDMYHDDGDGPESFCQRFLNPASPVSDRFLYEVELTIEDALGAIKDAEKERDEVQAKLAKAELERDALYDELTQAQEELADAQETISKLQRQLTDLQEVKEERDELGRDLDNLQFVHRILEQRLESAIEHGNDAHKAWREQVKRANAFQRFLDGLGVNYIDAITEAYRDD